MVTAAVVIVALIGSIVAAVLLSGDDSDQLAAADPQVSPTASAPPPATSQVGHCVYTENGEEPARPVTLPEPADTVDTSPAKMIITTDKGTMTAALDAEKAPCTVHALRTLAEAGYFDDTTCHRQTGGEGANIFVLQCGDPTGTGMGSPGYGYANENTEGVNYNRGVIAMAHGSLPDSNGSQFFINYADPTETGKQILAGNYTVFGQITEGLDVLDALTEPGIEGGGSDGPPVSKPKIQSIEIIQPAE